LSAAKTYGEEHQRGERQKAGVEKAHQAQYAAMARKKHLDSFKRRSDIIWAAVETLAATRQPKSYDQAVQHT
jgi:hypothetical protein